MSRVSVLQKYNSSNKAKATKARYYKTPKGRRCQQNNTLVTKHGITILEYECILAIQNGVCGICGSSNGGVGKNGAPKKLAVDHNHVTGTIRGLLCENCNRGIGMLKADYGITNLKRAIQYLEAQDGK